MKDSDFKLQNLLEVLDKIAPPDLAESWDNVGLMIGDTSRPVTGITVGLDPTPDLLDEALASGCNTIITHHPLIFHPLRAIRTDTPSGNILKKAILHDLNVIGCHTNLDVIDNGVNDALAEALGLVSTRPLAPNRENDSLGFGRLGSLATACLGVEFVSRICKSLDVEYVQVAGAIPVDIRRVAVCGGSGSDLASTAQNAGADIYITGEVKHSTARWAEDNGFCIVDAGHFGTENVIVDKFVGQLERVLGEMDVNIAVRPSVRQKNPFRFVGST